MEQGKNTENLYNDDDYFYDNALNPAGKRYFYLNIFLILL